jgi:predicted N-acetyltransferase YhbS
MNIQIKECTLTDFKITENLTRETFWNLFKPGCDEHLVLHKLRKSTGYISELDLVAALAHCRCSLIFRTKELEQDF